MKKINIKITIPLIIKSAMVLFLVIYLGRLYVSDYAADISMDQIASSLETDDAVAALDEPGANGLRRFYQIDGDSTDGYFFRKAASPMAVDEAFVVKADTQADAAGYLEAAQSHLKSQKNIFEGYGTDQMALLNKAVVEKRGRYVWYFCGSDAAKLRQIILSLI